jgi:hypothetical protein
MSRHSLGRASLLVASVLGALALYSSAAYAAGPPIVTVGAASNLTLNTATLNGTVDKNGAGNVTYKVEYGKSKLYGNSTTVKSSTKTGVIPVSEVLVGLENLATYHFRVSATNSFGTTVSEDVQFEMLLRWKVNGKPVSELEWPASYAATGESQQFKITGKIGLTTVEITCALHGGEPFSYEAGVLGSNYRLPLIGCKTYLNGGSEAKACEPKNSVFELNSSFAFNGGDALTLGTGECSLGGKLELGGGGFAAGPMPEQVHHNPISFTGYLPKYPGLTISYSSAWALPGYNGGLPFGIS